LVDKNNKIRQSLEIAKKRFLQKKLKLFIVTISTNTSLDTNKAYLAPLREIGDKLIFGVIVYSQSQLVNICRAIDKVADVIFVDAEKKIPFSIGDKFLKTMPFSIGDKFLKIIKKKQSTNEYVELGNLVSTVKLLTEKAIVREFKPNDITVEHAWLTLSKHFETFGAKKVAIIGSGNIGFKLALKLVESGVAVELYRRDVNKNMFLSNAINLVKPESTLANSNVSTDKIKASISADAIVGCSNSPNVINIDMIKAMKPGGLILDIGKANLTYEAIKYAKKMNIKIMRCDINKSICNYINFYSDHLFQKDNFGYKNFNKKLKLISGGYIGNSGDIVVDNFSSPKQILGISNGQGKFKKKYTSQDRKNLKKINKYFSII
jgi:hypothetical protein|tara:strand:- start:1538 stop:2668 length:1131 start_codon:yes stop_codon:yes gene_type:complete